LSGYPAAPLLRAAGSREAVDSGLTAN